MGLFVYKYKFICYNITRSFRHQSLSNLGVQMENFTLAQQIFFVGGTIVIALGSNVGALLLFTLSKRQAKKTCCLARQEGVDGGRCCRYTYCHPRRAQKRSHDRSSFGPSGGLDITFDSDRRLSCSLLHVVENTKGLQLPRGSSRRFFSAHLEYKMKHIGLP